ncbi:hypothetical protein [Actinomadura opuntiae]|uniref:hypothetical protein n=1 Tax=Actinomadura sp. OS1-43 TaxID=604315 RepID=UPI00255B3E86|nr:hypothetical protein [Actinomadura sp. OS1-43]
MTPDRYAEIRDMDTGPLTGPDAPYNPLALELNKAREDLLAELDAIRRRDETTGGVLYDVIRRARAGELDEHEAVRAIETRLIQPLAAQARAARLAAPGRSRRRAPAADRWAADRFRRLVDRAHDLRSLGEGAPGLTDTWAAWDRDAARALRGEAQ